MRHLKVLHISLLINMLDLKVPHILLLISRLDLHELHISLLIRMLDLKVPHIFADQCAWSEGATHLTADQHA
jgi:hypothetical protein